jgi:hypothetical protein
MRLIEMSSMVMEPDVGERRRESVRRREVLPQPVRPQTATFCPGWISKEIPRRTG